MLSLVQEQAVMITGLRADTAKRLLRVPSAGPRPTEE